ncbi:hypothetical protein CASFOL_015299 [Castilleja foliolosa]|uniref:DUF7032 domain-containing protein n=1 Tax=Castilleja foliolosa TaxID=1961234 RepID=A0ABD3DHA9_9LAMI
MSITCFASRWQVIRLKLAAVKSLLSEISESPHWSENSLLVNLLPEILSTLRRTETLCNLCGDAASSFSRGKLLMRRLALEDLSRPDATSSRDEIVFFVKDLFTRLQIGGLEFKRKALESLIQLLAEDDKAAAVVAREANISSLISLLDLNGHDSISIGERNPK